MFYVKLTKDMGRGVFANKDIKAGEVICYCELLVLSEIDTITVNFTELKYYTFKFNDKQDCLVLGDGEIFNHQDEENVSYKIVEITDMNGTRSMMEFRALKDCTKDAQLFINYNRDVEVEIDLYKVNMIG